MDGDASEPLPAGVLARASLDLAALTLGEVRARDEAARAGVEALLPIALDLAWGPLAEPPEAVAGFEPGPLLERTELVALADDGTVAVVALDRPGPGRALLALLAPTPRLAADIAELTG